MPKVLRRLGAATAVLSLVVGGLVVLTATEAGAAEFPVSCASVTRSADLAAAITSANGTAAADTINITGGPCTFTFSTIGGPAANGNDSALPIVVQPLTINGGGSTLTRSTAEGTPNFRLLTASTSGAVAINNLIVTNGSVVGANVGGGLAAIGASVSLTNVTVSSNKTVSGAGGGLWVLATAANLTDTTASGNGSTSGLGGGAFVQATTSTLNTVTVASNVTGGNGGGLYLNGGAATLSRFVAYANFASGQGGGLYGNSSSVAQTESLLQQNVSAGGGAMFLLQGAANTSSLRRSAVLGNLSTNNGGLVLFGGTTTIENDTFWSNGANNGIGGVLLANNAAVRGLATVASSTFVDNGPNYLLADPAAASSIGSSIATCFPLGGICGTANGTPPQLTLRNSIITDTNSTTVVGASPCDTSLGGTIVNGTGNIEFPTATCAGAQIVDPKVAPLVANNANTNGGTTLNFRLLPGSPAIDNPNVGIGSCPTVDQRNTVRPDGLGCDVGAYEVHPPNTIASGNASPTNDPTVTFSSDQAGATFECNVDGGAWSLCTSPFHPALTDGVRTVGVRALAPAASSTNTANNVYTDPTPATVQFTVDTTGPVVVVAPLPVPIKDNTPNLAFSVTGDPVTVTCKIDDGSAVSCPSSPYQVPSALGDGDHTFTVTATDAAGNVGTDSETFTVDTVGPTVTIDSGPSNPAVFPNATFTFHSASDANATFECKVDSGDFATCTSPHQVTVAPGAHTFSVRAIDPATNVGSAVPYSWTHTPDTELPVVTASSPSPTPSDDVTITFSVSEPTQSITCKVDDLAPVPCTAPTFTAQDLDDGPHTFVITATDPSGNVGSATVHVTVDTVVPAVVILTAPPAPPVTTADNTPEVTFSVDDESAAVTCSLDGGDAVSCSSPFEPGAVFDGLHTITVHATDGAGNTGSDSTSFQVSATPPQTTIGAGGPTGTVNSTSASFTFSASEPSTFQCRLDLADFAPCTSPVSYSGLSSGLHVFRVVATDGDGNEDPSPAERAWIIDATPPVVTIGTVASPTSDNTVTVPFQVDATAVSVTCSVDGQAAVSCPGSSFTTGPLSDGSHTIAIAATDAAGNVGTASVSVTVDTSAPTATITGGPTGTVNVPQASFTFTSEPGATFECRLDGGSFGSCTSPKAYTVAAGAHTFSVRATDGAGNVSAIVSRSWTYKACVIKVVLGITVCI